MGVEVLDPLELPDRLRSEAIVAQKHAARMSKLSREAFVASEGDERAQAAWQVQDAELYAEARRWAERAAGVEVLSGSPP